MSNSGARSRRRAPGWYRIGPGLLLCSALAAAPALATDGPAYFRMKQVQVIDRQGFNQPMPALELMIPTDWSIEGQVVWGEHGCSQDQAWIEWHATSPDGKIVIEGYPPLSWQYSTSPQAQRQERMAHRQQNPRNGGAPANGPKPCPFFEPLNAAQILGSRIIPAIRPGKQVLSMEPLPDMDKFVKDRARALEASAGQAGQPMQVQADAARARLKYDVDGQPVEEWVIGASVLRSVSQGNVRNYGNQAVFIMTMRAPAGQLDAQEKLLRVVRTSIHVAPQWSAQYADFQAKKQQIQNDLVDYAVNKQLEVNRNAQRVATIGARQADQGIRDVETYRDPSTGRKVELSNQYGHAWSNGDNQYILSDDPNFDPNGKVNGNWTALEHAQPDP
jgi:hypothetical protein